MTWIFGKNLGTKRRNRVHGTFLFGDWSKNPGVYEKLDIIPEEAVFRVQAKNSNFQWTENRKAEALFLKA